MLKVSKIFRGVKLSIIHGDLTSEKVDAIVNAANGRLSHGGGVAAAIVKKGGFIIQQESDKYIKSHGHVKTGEVGLTSGGKLKCRYIIHAVGPIFNNDLKGDSLKLKSAVLNSLRKAETLSLSSISIPALSSGIFGFPKDICAQVLIKTSLEFIIKERQKLNDIRFVNLDVLSANIFSNEFQKFMDNENEYLGFILNESEEVRDLSQKLESLKVEDGEVKDGEEVKEEAKSGIVIKDCDNEEKNAKGFIREEAKLYSKKENKTNVQNHDLNKGVGNRAVGGNKIGTGPNVKVNPSLKKK